MGQGAKEIKSLPPNGNTPGLLSPMLSTNVRLVCLGTGDKTGEQQGLYRFSPVKREDQVSLSLCCK